MSRLLYYLSAISLALYPGLHLFNHNFDRLAPQQVVAPLLFLLALGLLVASALPLLLRDKDKGRLAALGVLALFAVWGVIYRPILRAKLFESRDDAQIAALVLLLVAIIAVLLLTWKLKPLLRTALSQMLAIFGLILVVEPLGGIIYSAALDKQEAAIELAPLPAASAAATSKPNIYYLMLDGFGRSDVLKELYGIDIEPYMQELEALGMYVARQSHSNYPQTLLSLGSTLNSDYLDTLLPNRDVTSKNRSGLRQIVSNNRVMKAAKSSGYHTVYLRSGYSGTDGIYADQYLLSLWSLGEFEQMLLNATPVPALLSALPSKRLKNWQYSVHRKRIRFAFDSLAGDISSPQPRFVFAHILTPHPPFVFTADGRAMNPRTRFAMGDGTHYRGSRGDYLRGYAQQVRFAASQAVRVTREIIRRDPNAVILMHGDHGPGAFLKWESAKKSNLRERFSIFNAYYVAPELKAKLYPSISPVNSFRMIFSHYWGLSLPTLPDRSYFARWSTPLDFIDVTAKVTQPANPRTEAPEETRLDSEDEN